jgi:quinol monooxygenase YgiN
VDRITLVVEFAVKPGLTEAYRDVSGRMRVAVEAGEPRTLQYDWWLSDDGSRGINIESFADSDALAFHMDNTAPLVGDLLAAADVVRVEVLGQLTDVGRAAIEAAATGYFGLLGGIER